MIEQDIEQFISEYGLIYPTHEWEMTVWPMAIKYNTLLNPAVSEDKLRFIYDTILGKSMGYAPSMSFSHLMGQEFPKGRYALDPFFEAGTLNMISAPPNTWKSWLILYFGACIASGSLVFERFTTEKAKVMIVNEEDSYRSIQDRFKLLGITDQTLPMYFRIAQGTKLGDKFIQNIIKESKEKEITIIIFDSLRSIHNANENDSTEMQKILDLLKTISREGITVIFTHHHRKQGMFNKKGDPEASRGSSAINAAISGHISLEEEERESGLYLIVHHLKSKAGEKLPPFELKIIKGDIISFLHDGEMKTIEKKLNQAKDDIVNYLSNEKGWKTRKEIIKLNIASDKIIRTALKILENEDSIQSMSRKEAEEKHITVESIGKANEKLYSIVNEIKENEDFSVF